MIKGKGIEKALVYFYNGSQSRTIARLLSVLAQLEGQPFDNQTQVEYSDSPYSIFALSPSHLPKE